MNFERMNEEIGRDNRVSNKIVNAFRQAFTINNNEAEVIAIRWGKWIKESHDINNQRKIYLANEEGIDHEVLTLQCEQTAMITTIYSLMIDQQNKMNECMAAMNQRMDSIMQTTATMQAGARNPNIARRQEEHANEDDNDDDDTTQQQPIRMQPGRASLTPAPPTRAASLQRTFSTSSNQTVTTGTIKMITMLSDHIQSKSLLKNGTDELVNELWKVKYMKIT